MMKTENKGLAFYAHAGSGNHGCEAIVDSCFRQMDREMNERLGTVPDPETPLTKNITLMTNSAEEDNRYYAGRFANVVEEQHMDRHFLTHAAYYAYRKVTKDEESFLRYRFQPITRLGAPKLAVSIGGDNYCYPYMVKDLILTNSMLNHQGTKTMLLGCSIEPDLLTKEHRDIVEDMKTYSLILARESITYEALLNAGIEEDRVKLIPDPAFTLPVEQVNLSDLASDRYFAEEYVDAEIVGLNLSPLVSDYASSKDVALKSYEELIEHILKETNFNVALIPHVVWARSQDFTPLTELYEKFRDTGRVILIKDAPAERLKGVISVCRFFIGARTHATIAAYSMCVPTLVLGYSVKALGIAKDLFGTDKHFVVPVNTLTGGQQLIDAFEWMRTNERGFRGTLRKKIPEIRKAADLNGREVLDLYHSL